MKRQIKGVIFDVDGTLIKEISWQTLNFELGVTKEEDQRLFDEYHQGKFSYQQWVDQVVALYAAKGLPHRNVVRNILAGYTLNRGARTVSHTLQARRYHVGIVSAGLDVVVNSVARDIDVKPQYVRSNSSIKYDATGHLDRIVSRGHDHTVKLDDLRSMCDLWGILPTECACVGDSNADRPLFEATGNGITFKDDRCSMLHGSCWMQISDLPDLLKFL